MTPKRAAITPDGFEALYQGAADPWDTLTSAYEATKRDTLLRACGGRPCARGLELACGIGNNTAVLARRCLRLDALDASPTALDRARRAVPDARVTFQEARLPHGLPRGPFDLIVAAEIVYYLPRADADRLAEGLRARLAPGGRFVALHHTVPFHDAAEPPGLAHARLMRRAARGWPQTHAQHGRWRVSIADRPATPVQPDRRRRSCAQ